MTEQAFLKHLDAHGPLLRKLCSLYGNDREERRDLYQEMVLQAWRSVGRFDGRAKFSTWLYRVALNVALTYRRREARRPRMVGYDEAPPLATP
ncbi:MAG: sigma-70 family RNA polymerase sigma factor, partial [Catalinimonas sp.]